MKIGRFLSLALVLCFGAMACTAVDSTEHCVKTRFGDVKKEKLESGWNYLGMHDAVCFDMTDQNFPPESDENVPIMMEAQTSDPVTVKGDVSVIFAYDPLSVFDVYMDKRSEEKAQIEILNAIRSGYRNAVAGWSVADIFSSRRSQLGDSVQVHIQNLLGATNDAGNPYQRAVIKGVFIRDIGIPPRIEAARIEAARQEQILDQATQQFTIDSVNARALVIAATARAEETTLNATAYARNPALLQLEIAKAFAEGLAGICTARNVNANGVITETVATNCVIGGSIADLGLGGIQR